MRERAIDVPFLLSRNMFQELKCFCTTFHIPPQERMEKTLKEAGFTVAELPDSLEWRSKESEAFHVFLSGL
jgi:hypothetical protein